MTSMNEMVGGASDADKRIIHIHYGFVRALFHKLIEKGIITEDDGIEIIEESKKEWKLEDE